MIILECPRGHLSLLYFQQSLGIKKVIDYFYNPMMCSNNKASIPTEIKARLLLERLKIKHKSFEFSQSQTLEALSMVHTKVYIKKPTIGWGTLNNALAQVNCQITAAESVRYGGKIVMAPTSGFHHAGWDSAWGFCTFNGLVAAALEIADTSNRLLILDGDQHEGDGTIDIISRLNLKDSIVNYTMKSWNDIPDLSEFKYLFYQAGADAHESDGGYLDDEHWKMRDDLVFSKVSELDIGCVVNLAGGYMPMKKVLDLHESTYWSAMQARYGIEITKAVRRELVELGSGGSGNAGQWARHFLFGEKVTNAADG